MELIESFRIAGASYGGENLPRLAFKPFLRQRTLKGTGGI
jgi:hypothetical protein